ncbi:MAG: hypothetical protein ACXVYM_09055 [Gaiellaceae bacterium]
MAGSSALVAQLDSIPFVPDQPFVEGLWKPVRAHFGISAFGTNAYVATEEGQVIIEEHDELPDDGSPGEEELYVVLRGQAEFRLDGNTCLAPAGTFVFAPPAVKRVALAREPGTAILAVGATPGKAFEPSKWERAYTGWEQRYSAETERPAPAG